MSIFKERWVQPELYDCEVNGHQWECGTNEWFCLECEEIYDGDDE